MNTRYVCEECLYIDIVDDLCDGIYCVIVSSNFLFILRKNKYI